MGLRPRLYKVATLRLGTAARNPTATHTVAPRQNARAGEFRVAASKSLAGASG